MASGLDLDGRLERAGYELEVEDTFESAVLDERLWIPAYLPHWSSRARSAARYRLGSGALELLIEEDQAPWCPEFDGQLRVSSLQTGQFAGPVGSGIGQHRFREGLIVREEQPPLALYAPRYGLFECRAQALADPAAMVALWMIGFEDRPERSAEVCIFEIFGRDVKAGSALVGMGLHPFGDRVIRDDFERVRLDIDVGAPHEYAVEWTPEQVAFFVDGCLVRFVRQSPGYPMQFMLDIFEFPEQDAPDGPPATYPKVFRVEWFRGSRPTSGPGARPPAFSG